MKDGKESGGQKMKIEEFNKETQQLERFYEKEIPEEQKKIWYEEFKKMPIERYRYLIGQAYRKSKFIPKLADMIEINKNCGYVEIEKEPEKICTKCNGLGYITYKKKLKEDGYEYNYACRCTCPAGMKLSKSIPTWQEIGLKL